MKKRSAIFLASSRLVDGAWAMTAERSAGRQRVSEPENRPSLRGNAGRSFQIAGDAQPRTHVSSTSLRADINAAVLVDSLCFPVRRATGRRWVDITLDRRCAGQPEARNMDGLAESVGDRRRERGVGSDIAKSAGKAAKSPTKRFFIHQEGATPISCATRRLEPSAPLIEKRTDDGSLDGWGGTTERRARGDGAVEQICLALALRQTVYTDVVLLYLPIRHSGRLAAPSPTARRPPSSPLRLRRLIRGPVDLLSTDRRTRRPDSPNGDD